MSDPFNPFNAPATPTATPTLTEEQRAQLLKTRALQLKTMTKQAVHALTAFQNTGVNLIWNDSNLTPQEIYDAVGVDGYKLNEVHRILTEAIVAAAAVYSTPEKPVVPSIKLPKNAMTYAPDGRVTVTTDPYGA